MKRLVRIIFYILTASIVAASCSTTRVLKDGEYMLADNKIIVTNDKEEESYVFFYDKTENARHFFPADDIDFFATNHRSRLTAKDVRFLGTSQPVVEAKFVGRREENKQIVFSFNHKGTVLDVSINEKAVHRDIQYSNLCIGRSYKIIKGSSNYILEK